MTDPKPTYNVIGEPRADGNKKFVVTVTEVRWGYVLAKTAKEAKAKAMAGDYKDEGDLGRKVVEVQEA